MYFALSSGCFVSIHRTIFTSRLDKYLTVDNAMTTLLTYLENFHITLNNFEVFLYHSKFLCHIEEII